MWIEYILIILLFLLLCYFIYKFTALSYLYLNLKRELNSQTLDYHLKKIKEAGYDFTIKAGSNLKKHNPPRERKIKKGKKGLGSFNDLLE
jgi:hypothetical protein